MSAGLDTQKLELVFQSRPDILTRISRAADSPDRVALFNEIASHVYSRVFGDDAEPAHKRRKVDANGTSGGVTQAADEPVLLEVKEISLSIPQRKKFDLCFTANHLYARAPGTTTPMPGIIYAFSDIEYAFYLPVPDKAQVQHNYLLFPRGTSMPSRTAPPTIEPLVFTVPATAPKPGTVAGSEAGQAAAVSDTYQSLFHWILRKQLNGVGNDIKIVSGDPNKFHSMIRQPQRPNEKAVHVSGFRGSKDGYLFFLENGILWGYKKPLIFIPLNQVAAISYTSVLQITFNTVVEVFTGEEDATEEIEFGMIDQQDFGGIDAYVRFNRLQDRSMAEQRKGKLQLAENRAKKTDGATNGENGEGSAVDGGENGERTQLEQAHFEIEQQLQDDEDEEEEDYDPGSGGESEGSGSSDDEGEDDEDAAEEEEEEGEEEGEEEYDEDAEGEQEEEEEEEEAPVKQEAKPKTARPSAPPSAPVPHRGWAAVSNPRPADNLDMDETFDVA